MIAHEYIIMVLVVMIVVKHGHIHSKQINQNVEPKTFFLRGMSHYLAEIRGKLSVQEKELWISSTTTNKNYFHQLLLISNRKKKVFFELVNIFYISLFWFCNESTLKWSKYELFAE